MMNLESLDEQVSIRRSAPWAGPAHVPNRDLVLTPTQLRVMEGVRSGMPNKQIAFALGIAEATVKAHMTALMRKLNVRNRTQVALVARHFASVEAD